METMLEMVFATGFGKKFRVTFDSPREDLDPAEVEAAMETVIGKDVFEVEGGLAEIDSAQLVTTQTEVLEFA